MPIKANDVHRRTVNNHHALLAHPEYRRFMPDPVWQRLESLVAIIAPALIATRHLEDDVDDELSKAEVTVQNTRQLTQQVQHGVRFLYRNRHDILSQLAPLRLGKDPREDAIRLATLIRVLPVCEPPFCWLPSEGLTLEALIRQQAEHEAALKVIRELGPKTREAYRVLREQRPEAHRLWEEVLDPWILAHIPRDMQRAFGREPQRSRRGSRRPAKRTAPTEGTQPAENKAPELGTAPGAPEEKAAPPVATQSEAAPAQSAEQAPANSDVKEDAAPALSSSQSAA